MLHISATLGSQGESAKWGTGFGQSGDRFGKDRGGGEKAEQQRPKLLFFVITYF